MSNDIANLYIRVDSQGVVTASKDLDSLTGKSRGTEKATAGVTKGFSKLKVAVIALATSYAALKIARYIKDATLLAARYETLGVVMRVVGNNAGYTGAQMEEFAQGLQKAGIAMVESRNTLARMIQAQIDLTSATDLGRIAQDAAVIGNINSSEAFERLIYGIQTGMPRILRTIGLNVQFQQGYKALAIQLDKNVDQLSEVEIMQARVNTIRKAGIMIEGTYEAAMTTAMKQLLSLKRHLDNLKVLFGALFTPALAEIVEVITGNLVDLNGELSGDSLQAMQDWGNAFRLKLLDIEIGFARIFRDLNDIKIKTKYAFMLPTEIMEFLTSNNRELEGWNRLQQDQIDNNKTLIELENKRADLVYKLSDEGKAATKAVQEASEKKILAAQAAARELERVQKAMEAAQKATIKSEIDTTDFVKAYNEIEAVKQSASEMAGKIEKVYGKGLADAYIESVVSAYRDGILETERASQAQKDIWSDYNEDYQILLIGEEEFKRQQYIKGLDIYLKSEQDKTKATAEEMAKRRALILEDYDKVEDSSDEHFSNIEKFGVQAAANIQDAFSDFLYDAFSGKLETAEDYFRAFTDSLTRAWSNMLAQMILESELMSSAAKGIGSLLGMVGKFAIGLAGAGAGAGAYAASPHYISPALMHSGGVVGSGYSPTRTVSPSYFDNAPRLHNGLMGDEFPAILQRGETVIPKNKSEEKTVNYNIAIQAVDAKSFADMTKRNPQAIIGPIVAAINNNDPTMRSSINTAIGR